MGLLRLLERLLNDAVMGLLALVGFGVALAPFAFDIDPWFAAWLNVAEWIVLAAFVLDFGVGFATAKDRRRWIGSPWRIVDILCILGGIGSMLPGIPEAASGSVVMRLLRIGRIVAFATIAGTTVADVDGEPAADSATATARVRVYGPDGLMVPKGASWDDVMQWLPRPTDHWIDVCNAGRDELEAAARSLGIPRDMIGTVLDSHAGGRLATWPGGCAVSLWLPTVIADGFPEIRREQMVIVMPAAGIFTATLSPFELPASVVSAPGAACYGPPTLLRLLEYGLALHERALGRLDDELRLLEQAGISGGNTEFLSRVFRLRREISAAAADAGRFGVLVRQVAELGRGPEADLVRVSGGLEELAGRFGELKENLQSLMDLHLNVKSYQMNQFMRFLAVVSFLGLMPSIAGGLLGMNVLGSPWSITLPQVAFIVSMAIAGSLYLFAIRGWLR